MPEDDRHSRLRMLFIATVFVSTILACRLLGEDEFTPEPEAEVTEIPDESGECERGSNPRSDGADEFRCLTPKVYRGVVTPLPPFSGSGWHPLDGGEYLDTDSSGEAELHLAACGDGRLFVFEDSGLQTQVDACRKKTSPEAIDLNCAVEGTISVLQCTGAFRIDTETASVEILGTSYSVTYLPEDRLITLVVALDGRLAVSPVTDLEAEPVAAAAPISMDAGFFLFTMPDDQLGEVAGLAPRSAHPLPLLPDVAAELGIEEWMRDARDRAEENEVLAPNWPGEIAFGGSAFESLQLRQGVLAAVDWPAVWAARLAPDQPVLARAGGESIDIVADVAFNPDEAGARLDEAGFPARAGTRFSLRLRYDPADQGMDAVAEAVAEYLAQSGIDAALEAISTGDLEQLYPRSIGLPFLALESTAEPEAPATTTSTPTPTATDQPTHTPTPTPTERPTNTPTPTPTPTRTPPPIGRPGDFNRDGYEDLAIGVPFEAIGSVARAGMVNVLYGSRAGVSVRGNQTWHQDQDRIQGGAETGDNLGLSLAFGDFNGDSFGDLVAGVPAEDIENIKDAGMVNVFYGSNGGLTASGNQIWHQDQPRILEQSEASDSFGNALTVGDFNGDGFDDLAIGARNESVGRQFGAGSVNVLYGSPGGLSTSNNQLWTLEALSVAPLSGDNLGEALASSDFDGDGFDDLAIGIPGRTAPLSIGPAAAAAAAPTTRNFGTVLILHGSRGGLTASGRQFWHQDVANIGGTLENGDFFGRALASGDLNGDGFGDLAIGVPFEDVGDIADAGMVNILYGSQSGLASAGNQVWHQDSEGVPGGSEPFDRFGWSLIIADFDGDRFDDLAIGTPYEDLGTVSDAGRVQVLYGSRAGLSGGRAQAWHQDEAGVAGTVEREDWFGYALSVGDFNGDGFWDLTVGVPLEDVGDVQDAGMVNVFYGSRTGLTASGNQAWHQDVEGVDGTVEQGDRFGQGLPFQAGVGPVQTVD